MLSTKSFCCAQAFHHRAQYFFSDWDIFWVTSGSMQPHRCILNSEPQQASCFFIITIKNEDQVYNDYNARCKSLLGAGSSCCAATIGSPCRSRGIGNATG